MFINTTCNATLDDMRIGRSEVPIAGGLTFHQLGLIVSAACALIASLLSMYLMTMHATHYTKPDEQRHIIRILFMVPIYSLASFLAFWQYWHEIYYSVLSGCYEAFAIASFFALMCHYIAPDLHNQKVYFRGITPKPWVWPVTWAWKFMGKDKGMWRTPRSGLTWFNVIWAGIYQYCFIRVTMTVTAVITQYYGKYCDTSDSPVFAHIWILVIESIAVTIAMFCVIQFYIQLRQDLAPHRPGLKVVAIKAVIFLSFWQSFVISVLMSSTLGIIEPTPTLAFPDLNVGIPNLLLCIEMAIFAFLHLFAFPWRPYASGSQATGFPGSDVGPPDLGPKQGGALGMKAYADALNPWDLVKAFARSMRWLFIGVKNRETDPSYKNTGLNLTHENDVTLESTGSADDTAYKGIDEGLPSANEYRKNTFASSKGALEGEEGIALIGHAQPSPVNQTHPVYTPAAQRYNTEGRDITPPNGMVYNTPNPDRLMANPTLGSMRRQENSVGMAVSGESDPYYAQSQPASRPISPYGNLSGPQIYLEQKRAERERRQRDQAQRPSEQWSNSRTPVQHSEPPPSHVHTAHNMQWGNQAPPPREQYY